MGGDRLKPGDCVAIVSGAFAGMLGLVVSHDEAVARWPDTPAHPAVERGEALWVVLRILDHEVPVVLSADQFAAR
jgi:transcription antitermination factor NusG